MIASKGLPKKFPRVGEMVRVNGRKGLFLVVRVDKVRAVAHLKQRAGRCDVVEQDIPFELIQTAPQQKAIQSFLGAKSAKAGASSGVLPLRRAGQQHPQENISAEDRSGI